MKKYYTLIALLPIFILGQEKEKEIEEIVFQKQVKRKNTDLTNTNISVKQAKDVVGISGGIEGIIKTLPSVNSNTELSSQYMVRGGNFDENLIYINDIQIYRPFLIRNSQQEGMSIINPDMVSIINFSAGGFEARYDNKMSSALNIYYREPEKTEVSGEISLIGARLTTGFATKDKKLTGLLSARYRNTNAVLNTLNEDTDFNPQYIDIQSYFNYNINSKWKASFIGFYSKNNYEMRPKQKNIEFGSLQNPISLNIFYAGQENDSYRNIMGTASLIFKPNKHWKVSWDNFAYQNREKEYYSIASAYELKTFDPKTGEPLPSYDIGGQIDHARNDILVKTYGTQLRTVFSPNKNTNVEVGMKYEKEELQDATNEWQLVDYQGYSKPRKLEELGWLDDSALTLKYNIRGKNHIEPSRYSMYAQFSKKMMWRETKFFINAGLRGQYWDFNKETILSPRLQLALKPNWEADMLFKLSGGVYYQSPFYKEIKDLEGNLNNNIKSQKSWQIVLSNDYEFEWKQRNFKMTTEVYYKNMENLIPYYIDNVRIRYSGQNNAKGYAYGIDTRLYGAFVPGVDSWISASYARTYENINKQGYIPRPTDQKFRFAMFYQDYMPKFPSMKVNLTLTYASGLPNGASVFTNPYDYQKRLPSYKRVDIGLTKVFIDEKNHKGRGHFWKNFKELTLGVQIFNAFNINNTIANQWINDVQTGYVYPAPIRLTGRFFNAKLEFKF